MNRRKKMVSRDWRNFSYFVWKIHGYDEYVFVCVRIYGICLRMAGSIFNRFNITGVFRSLSARMRTERTEQSKRAYDMLWEKSPVHTSIFTIYPVSVIQNACLHSWSRKNLHHSHYCYCWCRSHSQFYCYNNILWSTFSHITKHVLVYRNIKVNNQDQWIDSKMYTSFIQYLNVVVLWIQK